MASLLTHCRRDLFHACWETLLDQEFLYAYRHGIVLKCADGIMRRVYPRIFTYSADYPEKYFSSHFFKHIRWLITSRVLVSTIKDMGSCPCPRCFMPKCLFGFLGLANDMKSRLTNLRVYAMTKVVEAHELIYQWGHTVDSAKVEDTLREGSWVPILVSTTNSMLKI